MQQVGIEPYSLDSEYLIELNGLRVPAKYDCAVEHGNAPEMGHATPGSGIHWGLFWYFNDVASRWHACWLHHAAVKSGLRTSVPELPIVDDEYQEHVAIYQAVLRSDARRPFVVAELGARWGTWAARAVAFARAQRPAQPRWAHMVEPRWVHCDAIQRLMADNGLVEYSLDCANANAKNFKAWLHNVSHVDVVDVDIQGAESSLLPALLPVLERKVYRLVLATHSDSVHRKLRQLFSSWISIWDVDYQRDTNCVSNYLRGYGSSRRGQVSQRFNWTALLAEGCYHKTPLGPVAHFDGELVLDNPRFVNGSRAYSPSDTVLKIHELYPRRPRDSPHLSEREKQAPQDEDTSERSGNAMLPRPRYAWVPGLGSVPQAGVGGAQGPNFDTSRRQAAHMPHARRHLANNAKRGREPERAELRFDGVAKMGGRMKQVSSSFNALDSLQKRASGSKFLLDAEYVALARKKTSPPTDDALSRHLLSASS